MSAIAGILQWQGNSFDPTLIHQLTQAQRLCGPDAQTEWINESVALGHCMLHATPESLQEQQPLQLPQRNLVMVWDGRLDNRDELLHALQSRGLQPRDNTDAELALQSFALWGEQSPEHLLGDFAFAVWDTHRKQLFCARDHMGARPFYYCHSQQGFAFASEEEALLVLPGVSKKPDAEKIATVLVSGFRVREQGRSWLQQVNTLPPASHLLLTADGNCHQERYWQLQAGSEATYASDAECVQAFLDVFGAAVRCRLRSRDKVAMMLSGGMDSASILAMAQHKSCEQPDTPLHTYSAIHDQPQTCVESQCIQALAQPLGAAAHYLFVPSFTGMLGLQELEDTAWSRAHPVDNSILLPAMMCRAACNDGHRVMLHGMGGDYTTAVQRRYLAVLLRKGQWQLAWREAQAAALNHPGLKGSKPLLLLLQNAWTAFLPRRLRDVLRTMRRWWAVRALPSSLIKQEFAQQLGLLQKLRARAWQPEPAINADQLALIESLQGPDGFELGLNGYNRVAGRYGIELRDPWCDRRVVEFWLRLPLRFKVRDGWTKYLVRHTFAPQLPAHVIWRSGKEHLGWYFSWQLQTSTNAGIVQQLSRNHWLAAEYLDIEAVRQLQARVRENPDTNEWEDQYQILSLLLWLQRLSS